MKNNTWNKMVRATSKKVGPFYLNYLLLGIPIGIAIWAAYAMGQDWIELLTGLT